jgi:Ca-activated chloride channel family protein
MMFLVAWRLLLLLGVGALVGAWVASLHRRRRDTVRFTNVALLDVVAPERPSWRRHLPAGLWLAALALLVVGFARPARTVEVPRHAIVVLAVDVSLSMEATDVSPSRLDVAKAAARDFVDGLPEQVELGLVIFSGSVHTVEPTNDHDLLEQAIDAASLSEGTAIGEAIFAGLDLIAAAADDADDADTDDPEVIPGRMVVLSDGDTTMGRPDADAAEAAAEARVPVDTIAFGTAGGEIVQAGEVVPVPVAPAPLQDIASTTQGDFFEADSLGALSSAYDDIGDVVGHEDEERLVDGWFIGAGLLLLAAAGVLSLLWAQRLP